MSHEAEAIANAFLRIAKEEGQSLSNMKMQKLLYFAQGHSLSLLGEELISDNCEAWDYGPVFPTVYRQLRQYGAGEIKSEIEDVFEEDRFKPDLDHKTASFLRAIWKKYGKLSAMRLSEMSHVTNGPWASTRRDSGTNDAVIKKELIRDYFNGLAGNAE